MNNYMFNITVKTKIINVFRRIFLLKPLERYLVTNTIGHPVNSFAGKLVPSSYMYPKGSYREGTRGGINYTFDISDMVDHYVYFGFVDNSTQKLYSFVKKGFNIIDIGVNIGSTALNFSKIVGSEGKVIGFEPDEINYKRVCKNLALNPDLAKNIVVNNFGLGNSNTTHKLYRVNPVNQGMNRILNDDLDIPHVEISVRKLDDYISEINLEKADLIKIDVEGFEMNVLKGAEITLRKFHPILYIEVYDYNLKVHNSSASELVGFLRKLNYRIFHSITDKELFETDDFTNFHYDIYALNN